MVTNRLHKQKLEIKGNFEGNSKKTSVNKRDMKKATFMILFNNTHWWEEEGMFTAGFKMNSHNFIL